MMKTYFILSFLIICTFGAATSAQIINNAKYLKEVEEEKATLQRQLKYITEPGLREKKLLEMLAHEKVERREEFEKLNKDYGGLEQLLKQANQTLLSLSCTKQFRYRMDIFGLEFGHHGGKRLRSSLVLTAALNNIKKVVKDRSSIIHDGASRLATLYEDFFCNGLSFDSQSPELLAWTEKVKFAYKILNKVNITGKQLSELPTKPSISNLIMQIQSASDEQKAVELFQKQCENDNWAKIRYVHHKEYPQIKKLATLLPEDEKRDLIDNFNKKNFGNLEPEDLSEENNGYLQREDLRFLRNLLKCGTYFVKDNERYEACVEVFYFAPSNSFELLKSDLERIWPELYFSSRVDKFCDAFATLYGMISIVDVHLLPNTYLMQCDVDSMYFYNYIKRVVDSKHPIDDFIVVSQVLGKISFDFTTPVNSDVRRTPPWEMY